MSIYSYNLHVIKTDKFKTVTVKVNFKRKLTKEDITYRNLLVNVLCESTRKYPTKRSMEIKTEDLYSLGYRGVNYISGRYNVMSFDATFLNEKYTEKGMLKESIKFLSDIIFDPDVEKKGSTISFKEKSFSMAYNNVLDGLKSIKEYPNMYSKMRMLECMDPKSLISFRNCGYIEDLEGITKDSLYKYYDSMLRSDIVDIFVIGDVDSNEVRKLITDNFNIKTIKKPAESHFIVPKRTRKFPKAFKEKQELNQSQLVMGFKIDKLSDFELRYVLSVYSYILGGGPDSKLFKEVREKNSLCYTISSSVSQLTNILTISAGINAKEFKKTVNLIKKEVKKMEKGDFSKEDIIKAKVTYINGLKELGDNPNNILNMYLGMEYLKSDPLNLRINKINKVEKDNIVKLASKIHLDTIYLLEGCDDNEEE